MGESKISQCINILTYNPNPTTLQAQDIADKIGCKIRTVWRALKVVRDAIAKTQLLSQKTPKKPKPKKKKKIRNKKGKFTKYKKPTSYNPNPKIPTSFQPKTKPSLPKIPEDITFERFCKYFAYPYYDGLYIWQYDWFKKVWICQYSLTLVARDHGKSIGHSNLCQWVMSAQKTDILYLGWTSRRKEIADFVYTFFLQRKELVIDKMSSNFHFKTTYGTKFDTYSVKSKETLGMHDIGIMDREIIEENEYLRDYIRDTERPLLLIIDDAIDNTFKDERHKEKKLEDFFKSTIVNINPNKLMVVGTKKFKEDFYYFIENFYAEEDFIIFKNGPYLKETDPRYNNEPDNPSNLLCPERWIDDDHPLYLHYRKLKKKKLQGEDTSKWIEADIKLAQKKDLTPKKKLGYWYHAEYKQDPHPIIGEVWPQLVYKNTMGKIADYRLIIITIDRATTTNKKSSFTGITVFFRDKRGKILVTNDFTRNIRLSELLPFINDLYLDYVHEYGDFIFIQIVIEKQGGGDDFISLAEDGDYDFSEAIIPVHNTRDKHQRILDTLEMPIKNGLVRFLQSLENSELVNEIGAFPNPDKIDALDSLANGKIEADKIPETDIQSKEKVEKLKQFQDDVYNKKETRTIRQIVNQHMNYNKKPGVFR